MYIKILLVDDDEDDRYFFGKYLHATGHDVSLDWVECCEDAMKALNEIPLPDMVFLDLNMPRINGFECLRKIRDIKALNSLPVIVHTTFLDGKSIEMVKVLGATDWINKPITMEKLQVIINKFGKKAIA